MDLPKNASFPRDQDPDYLRANQDAFKQSTKALGLEAAVSNTRTLKVLQFTFLAAERVHPATAVGWFTDASASTSTNLSRTNDRAAELGARAAKSADATVVDVGGERRVQDLGRLEAEILDPLEDALPQTEQDRRDVEGELIDHPS
jgi:hypothetical protein